MKVPTLSRELLEDQYVNKKLSLGLIAQKNHVTVGQVRYWMKKHNIELIYPKCRELTKDYLISEYVDNRRSMREIANEHRCSEAAVWQKLNKYGIPRHHSLTNYEEYKR